MEFMLTLLRIKDFALIEALEMELGPGLTVLTGETGAGKSIILAAVELLLGQRARSDLIRAGAVSAVVEAVFEPDPKGPVAARLRQEALWDEGELLVRRVVSAQGRNRVQVGEGLATVGLLAEIGPELLNICGQHAQTELLSPDEHLLLLDAFGGLDHARGQVSRAVARVRELDAELAELEAELARAAERRELLQHTVSELEGAGLSPGEEAELLAERNLLANSEQIARLAQGSLDALYAAEEGAVLEALGRVRGWLAELARLDGRTGEHARRLDEAFYTLEDIARELQDYAGSLSFDPGRLDVVEARLLAIQRLARKHGGDVPAALETLERARRELEGVETGRERMTRLAAERARALAGALDLARELSAARRRAAAGLARAAEAQLKDLGMASCRFEARLAPAGGQALATEQGPLGSRGLERVEFFIAPNPGEGMRPLTRIASGGELSRILLALKGLVAARRGAETQVFDEVDAGIGGAAGAAVGAKLAGLARHRQVICITHLPQIAAFGDSHFSVGKSTSAGRTATVVRALEEERRVEELTRMLAGAGGEETAARHARELLSAARRAPE